MDLGFVLARFWGILLVVACSAFLINRKLYNDALNAAQKEEFLLFSGFLALLLGAMHVSVYTVWDADYRGIITLLGWTTLIKGVVRLMFPTLTKRWIESVKGRPTRIIPLLIVFLILGFYLHSKFIPRS